MLLSIGTLAVRTASTAFAVSHATRVRGTNGGNRRRPHSRLLASPRLSRAGRLLAVNERRVVWLEAGWYRDASVGDHAGPSFDRGSWTLRCERSRRRQSCAFGGCQRSCSGHVARRPSADMAVRGWRYCARAHDAVGRRLEADAAAPLSEDSVPPVSSRCSSS